MLKNFKIPALALAIFLLTANCAAAAIPTAEEILNFDSDIIVNADSSMIVTETITVTATGNQIKRGIYRDFPLKYRDTYGNNYVVDFDIIDIKKDNRTEPYHTERLSNGIRIYIGQSDVFLEPGTYTYQITYKTKRQLGFFEEHDELYWNVTGNGWVFPILSASARVTLPPGIPADSVRLEAYTGPQGSKGRNYTAEMAGDSPVFTLTSPLSSQEGFTIVVGWPKGFVAEPSDQEKALIFFRQNLGIGSVLVGLAFILLYYLFAWSLVGRDPEKEAIIPQYESPRGLSPAMIGYIQKMGYRSQLLTASIIDLAIRGYVKIDKKTSYSLSKVGKVTDGLPDEERNLANELFGPGDILVVKNTNHDTVSAGIKTLKKSLSLAAKKRYFNTNYSYLAAGLAISLAFLAISVFAVGMGDFMLAIIGIIWLCVWTGVAAKSFQGVILAWKSFFGEKKITALLTAVFSVILFFILALMVFAGLVMLAGAVPPVQTVLTLMIIVVNAVFAFLLKAPTVEGRKLMDEIEGFKWFMSVTEKDRMNFHNPPEKTPELFEKFLPYALALGVENKWADQFTDVFKRLHDEGNDYQPVWYSGKFYPTSISRFTNTLSGSFSSAISSASVAPGSSSGFSGGGGGGGFSGGGGGGGGGGGW